MNTIDPNARISPMADIETSLRGSHLWIGKNTTIDAFVKIKFTGGEGDINIGDYGYLNSGTVIYSGNGVTIGNRVSIAANCTLAPVNHAYQAKEVPIQEQRFLPSRGGIIIGNDVWIGANSVILDGSIIPQGCVIGASSLVRGKLEAYGVYAGNPLKKIGMRT
jgi:virginiamycin A acetyltransferase